MGGIPSRKPWPIPNPNPHPVAPVPTGRPHLKIVFFIKITNKYCVDLRQLYTAPKERLKKEMSLPLLKLDTISQVMQFATYKRWRICLAFKKKDFTPCIDLNR